MAVIWHIASDPIMTDSKEAEQICVTKLMVMLWHLCCKIEIGTASWDIIPNTVDTVLSIDH